MEKLKLVEVKDNEVASTEDSHQDTKATEEESVESPAEGPPCAQSQEDKKVDS